MRYDHIVDLNNKMIDAREQADRTLTALHHQRQQLENLIASATQTLGVVDSQIDQLETFRHVAVQLAAAEEASVEPDEPHHSSEGRGSLILAMREADRREKANGGAN